MIEYFVVGILFIIIIILIILLIRSRKNVKKLTKCNKYFARILSNLLPSNDKRQINKLLLEK